MRLKEPRRRPAEKKNLAFLAGWRLCVKIFTTRLNQNWMAITIQLFVISAL